MASNTKKKTALGVEEKHHLDSSQGVSHNPFWQSTLFNEVYLQNDVPVKYKEFWEVDEAGPFHDFCNQFQNLCAEQKGADLDSWSERNTINRFIKPVLRMLGYFDNCSPNQEPWAEDEPFTVTEGGQLKTYKPDLIIVNNPKELKYIERKKGQEKLSEARAAVVIPIEAKYWDRIDELRKRDTEDTARADKKEENDSTRSLDFAEQCLKYMEILNKDFGILTDGKTWRLYNKELSSDSYHRCFQFNLGNLLRHVNAGLDKDPNDYRIFRENAKYFFHIFSKKALFSEEGDRIFVDELIEYSKKYVTQVEEDLKERFVKAMSYACNGFLRATKSRGTSIDLVLFRNVAESHLFNILFIKHCEARNILPLKQSPEYRQFSLSNIIDKLEHFRPEKEGDDLNLPMLRRMFSKDFKYEPDGTELYERLLKLTKLIQDGTSKEFKSFEIKAFRETIFSNEEWSLAHKHKLSNKEMISVLFELGYCKSGTKYQQIPYNFFSPRQLGSIYESFLGFRLEKAIQEMAFIKKRWEPATLSSEKILALDIPKVKKGALFFSPDNEERKATGSYYTPDCVVQYIVKETLAPLVKNASSKEILKLRVCDPAVGSGHFVSAALTHLSRCYLEALERETNDDLNVSLQDARRKLLPHCIFGVDVNARAVKLAKMSLWMESAGAGEQLEELEDQIKCTNSLTDETLWGKEWKFLTSGIDAIVGNPPYLGEKGHKEVFQDIAKGWLGKRFYQGKMDLLYFFFHLGLDALRSGGRLGFITTNYFTTAQGAKNLRTDLFERATVDLMINLNELKVFGNASGQHNMITVITKGSNANPTTVVNCNVSGSCSAIILESFRQESGPTHSIKALDRDKLFEGPEHYIRVIAGTGATDDGHFKSVLEKIQSGNGTLGDICNVNTGIQTGADKVTDAHLKKYKSLDAEKGDGIFILERDEAKGLNLPKAEIELLKPLFKNSDIRKFTTSKKTDELLIYLDRRVVDLDDCSTALKKHINKYRVIIDSSVDYPPYLHRPRNPEIFTQPKIVTPQRSKLNTFGYSEGSWYAASDVFFITKQTGCRLDIKYLLGVLNSKLYYCWLYFRGKRKGEALELIGTPLSEIPIKDVDAKTQQKTIASVSSLIKNPDDEVAFSDLNQLIYQIYGLSKSEISMVEVLYQNKLSCIDDDGAKKDAA